MKNQTVYIAMNYTARTPKQIKVWLFFIIFLFAFSIVNAQVKIGNNPNTINPNSLLELESTNKGFLPPRVALNDPTDVAPLTGTVPAGMLVYSSGGTLADGYYYWNGGNWVIVGSSQMVSKTTDAALTKTERFVMASNDITLTLPAVTAVDNGLTITVKNIGAYNDHVKVLPNGSSKIDSKDSTSLTRWVSKTFVVYGGNWMIKDKINQTNNVFEVSASGSWTTLPEVLTYLKEHMSGPSVVKLNNGDYTISATQVIDLPYPLTIQGSSYSNANLIADGLGGTPMFSCLSECYFKMLAFDGTATKAAGENAIEFETAGEYFEVKDCTFDGFSKALVLKSNVEVWVFEGDINNAAVAGIEVAAGATTGVTLKVSEVDFTECAIGVHLASGSEAITSIINSTFYNGTGGIGIKYIPGDFTAFSSMFITNNAWNNEGTFISGFDFSRTDGRDSKAFIQSNAGEPDRNPNCYTNLINNTGVTTTLSSQNSWYKLYWDYNKASVQAAMWTVLNSSHASNQNTNRITYQPINKRSGWFILSGNISCGSANRNISLGVIKNASGTSAPSTVTRLGETTIRVVTGGAPYAFSIAIYLPEITQNDHFELWASDGSGNNSVITVLDLQWYAETK